MAKISNPFRFIYRGGKPKTSLAVYKLWFGRKYLILKGKSLHQSVDFAAKQIDQQLRNGAKDDTFFYKAIGAIKRGHITVMEVEVLCQPETPAGMLLCEYSELQKAAGDTNCLNASLEVYMPKWIPNADIIQYNEGRKALIKREKIGKASNAKKGPKRKSRIEDTGVHDARRRKADVGPVGKSSRSVKKEQQTSGGK